MKTPLLKDYGLVRSPDNILEDYKQYEREHTETAFQAFFENKYGTFDDIDLSKNNGDTSRSVALWITVALLGTVALYMYCIGELGAYFGGLILFAFLLPALVDGIAKVVSATPCMKSSEKKRATFQQKKETEFKEYISSIDKKYETVLQEKQMLDRYYKDLETFNSEKTRQSVDFWNTLDGDSFEMEVANLFRKMGYSAKVSPAGPDQGIDIVLTKGRKRYAVQCKAHKAKVSQSVARDLLGTINNEANPFDGGFLICTHGVSKNTAEWCRNNGIKVYKTENLVELSERASEHPKDISQNNLNPNYIPCPRCNGHLVRRNGKYGFFYGCSNYPNCRYTKNIK